MATPKPHLEAYYDIHRKMYWVRDYRGSWIELTEANFIRRLHAQGHKPRAKNPEAISPLDLKLIDYQTLCAVDYAGPLAGYSKGVVDICGNRILVTTGPKLIEPRKGEWPILSKLVDNLFNLPGQDQRPYVFGWLRAALEALRGNHYRPGQLLATAGPADCGKSLFQGLTTEVFGGRSAKPYRYMSGGTEFNSDLFGAEHLMIEDDVASFDLRRRRHFGAKIKEFCVNEVQSCHAKNRPALSIKPRWRVSITLNDEPENLMILPPVDESLSDKIILLKARKLPMPMPVESIEQRRVFWDRMVSELPAFLYFLLHEWQIPAVLRSNRFGIVHYHHPELIAALSELSPEEQLLSLIDRLLLSGDNAEWKGTAEELQVALSEKAFESLYVFTQTEVKRLLFFPTAAGTYLGRLKPRYPERISYERDASKRVWIIRRAKASDTTPTVNEAPVLS